MSFTTRSRTALALCAGIILGFCGALAGGVLADRPVDAPRPAAASLPWQEASLFADVYERIKREYVDEVDDHALMEKAVRGMVAALDPHSAYLDSEEFDEIRVSTMGSYPGVGIEVVATDGMVRIQKAIEGSPAAQAGLLKGDQIVAIDGHGDRRGSRGRHRAHARGVREPRAPHRAPGRRALAPGVRDAPRAGRGAQRVRHDAGARLRVPADLHVQRDHAPRT